MALEHYANCPTPSSPSTAWTTLTAGIDSTTTTIPVASAAAFPSSAQYRITVDDEIMVITAGAGSPSWTATRGAESSTAAAHASGASVFLTLTAASLARLPRSMTTTGDLEYLNSSGAPTRLAAGADGTYLRYASGLPTASALLAADLSGTTLPAGVVTSSLTAVGTITSGTWDATVIAGQYGGTGVANTGKTITLGGNLVTSGAFATTLTVTNTTGVTLPTTGTLATLAGAEAFTNKTGNISQWTNDSGYLTSVTAHNVLSATHGDTLTASVVRGDILVGNSTPKWARLAIGSANRALVSDGTDAAWGQVSLSAGVTGVLPVANGGTNASSASITAFNNITGLSAAGTTGTTSTNLVFSTSPTFITPTLGAATATTLNGLTISTTTGTFTLTNGKTFAVTHGLTLAGTDSTTMTFPSTSATIARTDAANTFTGSQTIAALVGPVTITEAVGSSGLTITGATQTGASSVPVVSLTQTWNNGTTVFTAMKLNVTNTASGGGSLLQDWQVGGVSYASLQQFGFNANGFTASATTGGQSWFNTGSSATTLRSTQLFGWTNSSTSATSTQDLVLARDAANVLALRNSTTAQKFRVYNTFTTVATVGEWFDIDWITTANVLQMGTQKGSSTGTARVMQLNYGGTNTAAISIPITSGATTIDTLTVTNALTASSTTALNGHVTMGDAINIVLNTGTGTKIGTGTTQKLSIWNQTPIIQPAAAGQAAITDSTGGTAASSLVDVTTTGLADPVKCNANFATVAVLLLAIRTALVNFGAMKGSA